MSWAAALQIGQGVAGFIDANNKYKQKEYEYAVNRQNAADARNENVNLLNKRAVQEAEAASGRQFELALSALQESETRKLVSLESGVGGQTEGLKLDNVEARELRARDVINQNLEMTLDQIEEQKLGVNAQMKNRINSMPRGQKPSLVMHALGTASSAYSAHADVTGKNLFTGQALAKTQPNFVVPSMNSYTSIRGNTVLPNSVASNVLLRNQSFPSVFNQ
ncbi:hypothetical protein [Alteromonas sp.]|uniref:virion core protein, T7 gp14 family n=1 Tax=Alteromonas sp. TaxID=232 RepID=UPI000C5C7F1D|nr:hypothetical protein [Alteromonas sp.]MAI39623.1 hypothetical protein [Alteromonas sp.]|tara:strand:- start:13331 stop:13993 length:663 start_codon:yes stop_codon:yes gene_type:complete